MKKRFITRKSGFTTDKNV